MKIYTMGFTKKSAEKFFSLLVDNNVKKVVDIRLNTDSQLAGFAKSRDLEYFLKLHNISYQHEVLLAPTDELRKLYNDKKNKMSFFEYTEIFEDIMNKRDLKDVVDITTLEGSCYLCSEEKPEECHRNLVVKRIKRMFPNEEIEIIHLY